MTVPSLNLARASVWASLAFNLIVIGSDLSTGMYRLGTLNALMVVALMSWLWIMPKIEARLDAQIGQARAHQRIAELTLETIEQQVRKGSVHVDLVGRSGAERLN